MGVTELACFRTGPETTLSSPALVNMLVEGDRIMSLFNKAKGTPKKFYFLQQVEDPKCIYILGDWNSVAEHQEFMTSPENAKATAELNKLGLVLAYFGHMDCPQTEIPTSAEVLSIGIHKIDAAKRGSFEKTFNGVKSHLEDYVGQAKKPIGGWRVDLPSSEKEAGIEEFVLFCGWDNVDQHTKGFASSDGFAEYCRIAEFVKETDIKHARFLDLAKLVAGLES